MQTVSEAGEFGLETILEYVASNEVDVETVNQFTTLYCKLYRNEISNTSFRQLCLSLFGASHEVICNMLIFALAGQQAKILSWQETEQKPYRVYLGTLLADSNLLSAPKRPRRRTRNEWGLTEELLFLEGLRSFGLCFETVAQVLKTRNKQQVRAHYRNYCKIVKARSRSRITTQDRRAGVRVADLGSKEGALYTAVQSQIEDLVEFLESIPIGSEAIVSCPSSTQANNDELDFPSTLLNDCAVSGSTGMSSEGHDSTTPVDGQETASASEVDNLGIALAREAEARQKAAVCRRASSPGLLLGLPFLRPRPHAHEHLAYPVPGYSTHLADSATRPAKRKRSA